MITTPLCLLTSVVNIAVVSSVNSALVLMAINVISNSNSKVLRHQVSEDKEGVQNFCLSLLFFKLQNLGFVQSES